MHICGENGCHVVETDDEVDAIVEARRVEWATAMHDERGEYPRMDEQIDYVIAVREEEESARQRRSEMAILRPQARGEASER